MMELHVCNRTGSLLRAFCLGDDAEIIIGREQHCDVRIESKSISREHCAIERDGETMVLKDLGSKSGTLVQGRPIESIPVTDGLEVHIGPALLRFIDAGI